MEKEILNGQEYTNIMLPKQKNKNDSIDVVVIDDLADPSKQNQIEITIENKEYKE